MQRIRDRVPAEPPARPAPPRAYWATVARYEQENTVTDTAAPQTPADVFTRVLTENIGRNVTIHNGLEQGRYTHGKIVAVEAGVLTLGESFPGMLPGEKAKEWQSYHRIDSLTYVSPSSLDL